MQQLRQRRQRAGGLICWGGPGPCSALLWPPRRRRGRNQSQKWNIIIQLRREKEGQSLWWHLGRRQRTERMEAAKMKRTMQKATTMVSLGVREVILAAVLPRGVSPDFQAAPAVVSEAGADLVARMVEALEVLVVVDVEALEEAL